MKNLIKYITTLCCIIMALLLNSCSDQYTICELSKKVNIEGVFYSKQGNDFIPTSVNSLSIKRVDSVGFVFNNQNKTPAFIFLLPPLFSSDSVKYAFTINNVFPADTLTLHYFSTVVALTTECGSIVTHRLIRATSTTHTLDSVKIISQKIDNNKRINLHLFL